MDHTPTDAPPPYAEVAGSSTSSTAPANTNPNSSVPHKARNGIPPQSRRSMEDEGRPLPHGWFRQYDPQNHHQFFVDTTVDPPRSIWSHPYDDDHYMNGLDPHERQKIQGSLRVPSQADILADSSGDDDGDPHRHDHPPQTGTAELPPREANPPTGVAKLGRKMKDKLTHTTHEQRARERAQRAEEERRVYERHQRLREAMSRAAQTGEPQYVGKGKDGRDIYLEPPQGMRPPPGGGFGYNPYAQGPYARPNAMFIRPQYPYSRPYGGGYGGGMGLPLAGGLMGGMLMGSMMTGGMGGGMF